jgi:acetaldehyde dehydrogenase (acetylating)
MLQDKDLLSVQEVRTKVEKAYSAFQKFRRLTQEQLDVIVERMAAEARAHAHRLAEMAVEETGYGNAPDKLAKNLLCADLLPRRMRGMKCVGLLREIPEEKVVEIGVPVGVVAAILPTTNPTSTAIYKTLVSLKAGNTIVVSPHPNAKGCTCATTDLLYGAALEAGAPEDVIQCITNPTLDGTNALMRHPRTGVILSTGGHGIVKAAYSSGKPAFGVGPGNVPVLVDRSADIADAVGKVVEGKKFDYGTVCSSEQAIVAEEGLREPIVAALKANKAYFCDARQSEALAGLLITPSWTVNPKCVGQAPGKIAKMAGFEAPADTSILVVEIRGVGKQHPLSAEKLSPVLSLYFLKDFEACVDACAALLKFGGLGHTCVIHAKDDARIRYYGIRMPAFRVLVNTPAPQGSTGITTNVFPSMTLGCGAMAGNITSDNVGPEHLRNIKRIAYAVRKPEEAFEVPAAAAKAGLRVDRGTVAAAVERYLSERGIAVAGSDPAPAKPAPAVPASTVASVVDRFLAARKTAAQAASSCACATPEPAPPASQPPAPSPQIAEFVCEYDVRTALAEKRKIYIGRKTIVTPSARELGETHDILVST